MAAMAGVRESGGRVHTVSDDRFKREEELFQAECGAEFTIEQFIEAIINGRVTTV